MPKVNYHTHTPRCQHATGSDEDYIRAAIEGGYSVLGFADHAPWPFGGGYVSPIRMPFTAWPDYVRSISLLKEKYAGQIDIRLGLESEYFPRYRDHMMRLRDEGCEYFILGEHYVSSEEDNPYIGQECATDDGLKRYADATAEAIATGLFCCVAHPDLYMRPRHGFDQACMDAADTICQAAKEYHLPIEYNLLGLLTQFEGHDRGYPDANFWRYVRKWDNGVIIGVDAHEPGHLTNQLLWDTAAKNLTDLNFRIVTEINDHK